METKTAVTFTVGAALTAAAVSSFLKLKKLEKENAELKADKEYTPPEVWTCPPPVGPFVSINKPTAGPQTDAPLPRGKHPIQLHSLATPNGVKCTVLLEELVDNYPGFDYDAWLLKIDGKQFGSGFVAANPNSKIPAMLHYANGDQAPPVRVFESASILLYLCEKFDKDHKFLPSDPTLRTECLNWLFWQMGSAPYLGGGFGHFYAYAPVKIKYAVDRFSMEAKRQLDVLERHLGAKDGKSANGCEGGPFMLGASFSIADIAIWPWYGNLMLGRLYGNSEKFLNVKEDYPNVLKWAKLVAERPATLRGRKVNRSFGPAEDQLWERHAPSDFELNTEAAKAKANKAFVDAAEAKGSPLTAADPGPWRGKEGKHVPTLGVEKLFSGPQATAVVPHGMDSEHFIEYIWVRDQDGGLAAVKKLSSTDPKAELSFAVPKGASALTPFAYCNLHGVWKGETVTV